jgi:2-phosphoglycerate kinase
MVIQEFIKRQPMLAASTDAIRSVAKGISSPVDNPRLFRTERGTFGSKQHITDMNNQPDAVLKHEVASAEETWKSVLDFVSYYQGDGKDAAIEGVAVLPGQLAKVKFDFKAVFVVNLSDQTDNILRHTKNNPNDWLNKYDEETIRTYGKFNQLWNHFYADEAKKYGYSVVVVDTDNFETSVTRAVKLLQ